MIGFYNRDEKCLQRGTDWVFKLSSLRFVFKGLNKTVAIIMLKYVSNFERNECLFIYLFI